MTTTAKGIKLNRAELGALIEALRRRSRFIADPTGGRDITDHWTGLGTKAEYKGALDSGFMRYATSPNPRHMSWWKLTERGARIVAYWLGQGYTHDKIENGGGLPSEFIPFEVL